MVPATLAAVAALSISAAIAHETIRAVVKAYAAGLIELPKPSKDTRRNFLRYAPSFVPEQDALDEHRERPYSVIAAKAYGFPTPL